jgi:hypothetical protein
LAYLIAALAAPALGPVLYRLLHEHPKAVRAVDGFVYLAVPVLVAWQVFPHAWEEQNLLAIIVLVVGFLLPAAAERVSHVIEHHADNVALVVGLSGLVIHASLEGAALVPQAGSIAVPFALAVILHRIPVSLVIWWLIRPRFGILVASAGVGSLVLGTIAGYAVGIEVVSGTPGSALVLYQAFVSGSLVHVVFHQGRHDHQHV